MGRNDDDGDDYYYVYQIEDSSSEDIQADTTSGFDVYVESTIDPGPWLLLATCCVCFGFMLIVVPGLLWFYNTTSHSRSRRRRQRGKGDDETIDTDSCDGSCTEEEEDEDDNDQRQRPSSVRSSSVLQQVLAWDSETRKILRLAIPYTISALTTSVFSNTCLILVSMHLGVKSVAAYALVQVLCGLSDGVLQAPIYACTTLCAQAVGAGNPTLAGNRIQLAIVLYMVLQVPVILFWWFCTYHDLSFGCTTLYYYLEYPFCAVCSNHVSRHIFLRTNNFSFHSHIRTRICADMYETILFLEWGDTAIAQDAQDFVRVYIFSYTFGGLSSAVWQLLEVTGHAADGTIINTIWGATNVLLIAGRLMWWNSNNKTAVTLADVAWIYNGTSVLFIGLTLAIATGRGWLTPFWKGLIGSTAIHNPVAVRSMLRQAIPLAASSFLSNAEWAVLTLLASCLGPAEVAAWALLGSIWDVFYSVTAGIGDAAEIRVAFHLGNGSGRGGQISAYKSLFLGMVVASGVSLLYFSMQNRIPTWFTTDATLQKMLRELVPFVGVANLTMTFGMQCWSLIGAQGNYKYATWVSCVSSWGVCMPLAAVYVFILRLDLQGLTSAVVLGYLSTGSALSYKLLSTNWDRKARKIQGQNSDAAMGKESSDSSEEQPFIALRAASSPNHSAGQRKIQLITLAAGQRPGLMLGNVLDREGVYILDVQLTSPIYHKVVVGDAVLSIDGVPVSNDAPHRVSSQLEEIQPFERHLTIMSPPADVEDLLLVEGGCICWDDNVPLLEETLLDDNIMEAGSCELEHRSRTITDDSLIGNDASQDLHSTLMALYSKVNDASSKSSEPFTPELPGNSLYYEMNEAPTKSSDASVSELPGGCHHPSDECSETYAINTESELDGPYHALDGYVMHKAKQALVRVDDRCDSRNADLSKSTSANSCIGVRPTDEEISLHNDKAYAAAVDCIEPSRSIDDMSQQNGYRDDTTDPHPAAQYCSGRHTSTDSAQILYDTDSLCRSPERVTSLMDSSELATDDMIALALPSTTDDPAQPEECDRGQESTDPDVLTHSQHDPIQVLYETDSLCRSLEENISVMDNAPTETDFGASGLGAIEAASDDDSQCSLTPEEAERALFHSSWEEVVFEQTSSNYDSPLRRTGTDHDSSTARPQALLENTTGSPVLHLQPEHMLRATNGSNYTIPLPLCPPPIPERDHLRQHDNSGSPALPTFGPTEIVDVVDLCTSASAAEETGCEGDAEGGSRGARSLDDSNDSSSLGDHKIV